MNAGRFVVACIGSLFATDLASAQQKELPRVTVTCVDGDGKPVAGAEVHVFQHRKGLAGAASYEHSGPHATGADGVATTAIALDYDGGRFDRWLYARVPGKLVAAARWLRFDATAPADPAPVLRLEPSRALRGTVTVPDGVDASTVRVRTLSLSALDDADPFGHAFPREHSFAGLSNSLPDRFDAQVAADGSFELRDLPPRPLLYVAAEGPGLAQAQWFNALLPGRQLPDALVIPMSPEAVIVATVSDLQKRALANVAVELRLERSGPSTGVRVTFAGTSDASGRARIGGLPAGEYAVEAQHADFVMRPQPLTLVTGQTTDVALALEPPVEVRGIVRNATTHVGIERAVISAVTDDQRHWPLGSALTDPQGRFVLRLPQGATGFYVAGVPAGYQQPSTKYSDLACYDVAAGEKALGELLFEIEPAK